MKVFALILTGSSVPNKKGILIVRGGVEGKFYKRRLQIN